MENSHGRRLDALLGHLSPAPRLQFNQCSTLPPGDDPVVVGAMVLDIHAHPSANELRPGTTTPGRVQYVKGGVGRNVAECISKLGLAPFFISVVGQDMAGDLLLSHWQSLGLKTDGICRISEASTPAVSAIFDKKGELAGAVADTLSFENHLTPKWIGQFRNQIRCASLVMLDANLSEAALQAACELAREAGVPIWFEPVSVSKSVRHSTISSHLTFVSPNEAELVAMATREDYKPPENVVELLNSSKDLQSVLSLLQLPIVRLLERGIKFVVLTLGGLGVILCSKNCSATVDNVRVAELIRNQDRHLMSSGICYMHFPALPAASVVSLSGAGDCFVGGALAALCTHQSLHASMAFGIAVARRAIQSEQNVPSNLSEVPLKADVQTVLVSAKHQHSD
ncbi:hypothetical protein GOP47_0001892 [Adiantum capillus-veneris]|uniref:Carbohydrate kinase PfkB domain-containing protein n=1 Tax=Adiantum capillus-veneris TaxID=13818 RepID=A0A9D4ZNP5_ADICA|nr:hypothetical protein GOP47_0001892 [Adiantum capillus-veneris]